jgi:hypothetical protein
VFGHFRFRVVSGRVESGRLSGHFRFQIVLGQIRLVIGSSSVGSFRILNHIGLDRIRFHHLCVLSSQVG